jgi:hypothetical protein
VNFRFCRATSVTKPLSIRGVRQWSPDAERIAAMFGTPRQFAELFSEALIITPSRLHT